MRRLRKQAPFDGHCPPRQRRFPAPGDPGGRGYRSAHGDGTLVGSPAAPKFTRAGAAAAAVPRCGQQMAVWLHARRARAAISRRRHPGSLLKCRLKASPSGRGIGVHSSRGLPPLLTPARRGTRACARARSPDRGRAPLPGPTPRPPPCGAAAVWMVPAQSSGFIPGSQSSSRQRSGGGQRGSRGPWFTMDRRGDGHLRPRERRTPTL